MVEYVGGMSGEEYGTFMTEYADDEAFMEHIKDEATLNNREKER